MVVKIDFLMGKFCFLLNCVCFGFFFELYSKEVLVVINNMYF